MTNGTENKIEMLRRLAKGDEKYRKIMKEYQTPERKFSEMTNHLSVEQQNVAWVFVCTSDELDERMLEIACDYIDFNRFEKK